MDMSSNSQLVKFDTLFLVFYEFEHSFIKLNFWHVTINVGEGGGHPFRDLSLLFMSLFQGGGEGVGQFWTMSLILQFYFFWSRSLWKIEKTVSRKLSTAGKCSFLQLPDKLVKIQYNWRLQMVEKSAEVLPVCFGLCDCSCLVQFLIVSDIIIHNFSHYVI